MRSFPDLVDTRQMIRLERHPAVEVVAATIRNRAKVLGGLAFDPLDVLDGFITTACGPQKSEQGAPNRERIQVA
jgi:hypothetical protein